jgi:molybdate transport system regulatory protein
MRPRLKVWIESEDGRVALSDWRVALLEGVAQCGSLVAAARTLGVPHRTAWQRIQEMEACLGVRLLETTSGGSGGGGSHLTASGRELVRRYQVLRAGLDELVLERYDSMFQDLGV